MQIKGTQPQYIKVFANLNVLFVIFFTSFTVLSIILIVGTYQYQYQKSLSKRYQQSMHPEFIQANIQIPPINRPFQTLINNQEDQQPEDYYELIPDDGQVYFFPADYQVVQMEEETMDCRSNSQHLWDLNRNNHVFMNYQELENGLLAENGLYLENEDTAAKYTIEQQENESRTHSISFNFSLRSERMENLNFGEKEQRVCEGSQENEVQENTFVKNYESLFQNKYNSRSVE